MSAVRIAFDNPLGPIGALKGKEGQRGMGHYLLRQVHHCTKKTGEPYQKLALEDATGNVAGIVWPQFLEHARTLTLDRPVRVIASVRSFNHELQLHVERVSTLASQEVASVTALLRPDDNGHAAVKPALQRLGELEAALPAPLDGFLREVLLDSRVLPGLLSCRASVNHHHAFKGGLIAHSTAMLTQSKKLTQGIVPDDPWSPYLTQLGYLLHDLGKLLSVGADARAAHGLVVPHELLTIELLAPHLAWLDKRSGELAWGLRYILSHLATPQRDRGVSKLAAAEVVVMLDQLSAATHNQRDLNHLLNHDGRVMRSGKVHAFRRG